MNNAALFRRWASQAQTARSAEKQVKPQGESGNVFYEGPILYSYGHHFPLAVLTGKTAPDGKEIVLVNARSYSMTTAHYKSQAVRASSHKAHIYIPHPDKPGPEALDCLNDQTREAVERLKKIRSAVVYSERGAREAVETAELFRKTFLKGRGHVVPLPKDFPEVLAKAREREARHDAAAEVKREANRVKWERQRGLNALADAEKIAAWRAGENVSVSWGWPCMLRLKGTDTVETSLRVEIPLSHAERVYRLILGIMAKGEDWQTNGHTIPVEVYKVDSISKDGELRAGCHTLSFEEIQKFATERGWKP